MGLWDKLLDVLEQTKPPFSTYAIFQKNKNDMDKTNIKYSDKYFHSKANCQSIQKNPYNYLAPISFDLLKETYDTVDKNILNKNGLSFAENFNDSKEDMNANLYGLKQGTLYPNIKCEYLLEKYRPNGLSRNY